MNPQQLERVKLQKEDQEIRQSWEEMNKCGGGLCQLCDQCGGSSVTTCECAYQRYKNSLKTPTSNSKWNK